MQRPDPRGYFGRFGGKYVPEVLMTAIDELDAAMNEAFADPAFWDEYRQMLREYVNRPSPLYAAERFTPSGGAPIYFKREDLNFTGSHKINNTVGQGLLAQRMGKRRLIAETGAGQHGVATATVGARLGFPVDVFMGTIDVERQSLNVYVMKLLGATVHPVESGTRTLRDAVNEAFREWMASVEDTFYVIGSVVGAHPYPYMVREFHRVIGEEAREQILSRCGRLPTDVVACVGGGSNAMGIFAGFIDAADVKLWGAEAGGHGVHLERTTAASINAGSRRRPARLAFVRAARRERADQVRDTFDQRRARLSRRRSRACVSSRDRSRALSRRRRRSGGRGAYHAMRAQRRHRPRRSRAHTLSRTRASSRVRSDRTA